MLKTFKNLFLAALISALAVAGFASCSSGDDDDDGSSAPVSSPVTVSEQTELFGTYTGTLNVTFGGNTSAQEAKIKISEGAFALLTDHPSTYTKILWIKETDGSYVVAAQSDSTNTKNGDLTLENYKTASSCYVVFSSEITYVVPAMASMGGTCTLTKES